MSHLFRMSVCFTAAAALLVLMSVSAIAEEQSEGIESEARFSRLPTDVPVQITFWGLHDEHFEPGGYRPIIDLFAQRSPFRLLNTTLRLQDHPLSDPAVHDHLAGLVRYARGKGFDPTLDLCVRLDRKPFQSFYPDELQEMVKLAEVPLSAGAEAECVVTPEKPGDHMTYFDTPYISVAGRLLRVFAYQRDGNEILPDSVRDITRQCRVISADAEAVRLAIPGSEGQGQTTACVMACFTHLSPDVFSAHLLDYQRGLIRQYADMPLAGAFKDEWGFPRTVDVLCKHRAFWYSEPYAEAYARSTGGRDLVADFLLMAFSQRGRLAERQRAINHFMRLNLLRNAEIEQDFYDAVKEVLGPGAFVGKHPTWYPRICPQEYTKNGLFWWAVKRDVAQTDEVTPVFACTALAKKCGGPVWYNEFYSRSMEAYHRNIWRYALAGGRQIYHPPLSDQRGTETTLQRYQRLVTPEIMQAECRVRMLNFISRAPIDCPVAVVFGHSSLMNWAGPAYDKSGIDVASAIWKAGFPVDMIPSSEIADGSLTIGPDGSVQYGPQSYRAVVLVHPEFETHHTAQFFSRVNPEQTMLTRLGVWTRNFDAEPLDGPALLPAEMAELPDANAAAKRVVEYLAKTGVPRQAALASSAAWGGYSQQLPGMAGCCRLIDGTWIRIAAEKSLQGDPIRGCVEFEGHCVEVDAVGLVAVHFDGDGRLDAFAAGRLKTLRGGGLSIDLQEPADVALWRDEAGKWHGVLQDSPSPAPPSLVAITDDLVNLKAGI